MCYYKVKDEKIAVYDYINKNDFLTFIWKGQAFKINDFDKDYIRISFCLERFGKKEVMEGVITYNQFRYGVVKVGENWGVYRRRIMEIIKEILLWVGIVAILVPFVCMCLITIKDTIDYITDKGE